MTTEELEKFASSLASKFSHNEPSMRTKEELKSLNVELCSIKEKCSKHNLDNELMRRDLNEIKAHIEKDLLWKEKFEAKIDLELSKKADKDAVERLDKRKADKWVEAPITKIAWFVIMAVLAAMMAKVINS